MKRLLNLTVAALLAAGLVLAQAPAPAPQGGQAAPKKPPQAKTKEEFDAYQKFATAATPDDKIKLAEEFLQKFPDTELKGFARKAQMQAYYQKNEVPKVREYGEMAMALGLEEDLEVLLALATSIPVKIRDTDLDKEQNLSAAEGYARKAMGAIDKLQKPNPQITDDQWKAALGGARSQVYETLGMVAQLRKQVPEAEEAYRKSLELTPDNLQTWYRIGNVYISLAQAADRAKDEALATKRYEEALAAFEKVVAGGGTGAVEMRDKVKKVVDQRKAPPAPPKQ